MDNRRLVRITLIALLALGCVVVLQPFLAAILFAAVICITAWPLHAWLLRRLRGRNTLAASLTTLLLALGVLLPMALLAASLTDAVPALIDRTRPAIESLLAAPPSFLRQVPFFGESLESYWRRLAQNRDELNQVLLQFYDPTRRLLLKLAALAGEGLLQIVLVLFIAFFFFRDGALLVERLRTGGRKLAGDLSDQMLVLVRGTVTGVMVGIVGTAAAQSLVALIGFLVAGVPAAALLAAATFFLSMIPVGPPLIWGGAAWWLYDDGQTGWALFLLFYGFFVISSVDNVIKPLLISRSANLSILLIALGVFGGVLAFGFIGIFLGPTLLALGLVLAEKWTTMTDGTSSNIRP
jgi:predicted PurR-regulated permease PerM